MGFSTITVLSILLPAVFAVPHQPRHGHRTGTAPHFTKTYGSGNATYGPTGSGTGTGAYAYSTVTVVPIPATNSSSDLSTYTSAFVTSSVSESSIVDAFTSASASECASPTVTVTSSALVTITVTSSDSATAGQSTSSQFDFTNSTSSVLSSYVYQSIGTTSSIVSDSTFSAAPSSILSSSAPLSSAAPSSILASSAASFSASSYVEQSSTASYSAAQSSTLVVASTQIHKGYSRVSLPASSATSYVSVSSQADAQSVASSIPSATTAASSTAQAYASPTITASSISSGSGSGKRGLAYSIGQASHATHYSSAMDIQWAYNWEATREPELPSHIEFVPMLHSPDDARTSAWPAAATNAIAAGSKHLMSVNEPDQNNLTPASMAALHNKLMNPHSNGGSVQIGSPGVTQGTGPAGVGWGTTWLRDFNTECGKLDGGCVVDFVPVHWYLHIDSQCGNVTVAGCIEGFQKYVDQMVSEVQNIWPKANIWLDEFQIWNADVAQQTDFLNQMLPWLDSHAGVDRYSYFQLAPYDVLAVPPQFHMVGPDGQLNDVGNMYMSKK